MFLPRILAGYADFKIGMTRISELLLAEEVHSYVEKMDKTYELGIEIRNGTFTWETDSSEKAASPSTDESNAKVEDYSIQDITMLVPKGKLVALVGPVGSGKSTVLQSLVGETKNIQGNVRVSGAVGYAPQQAWIQNATVRENILFGRPFDEEKYRKVIHGMI